MAKDFFSQYILAAQGGQTISSDNANQIAQNTLSTSAYTNTKGAIYTALNLKSISKSSTANMTAYKTALAHIFQTRMNTVSTQQDPLDIFNKAIQSENESDLAPLDPIITSRKGVMSDMLNMDVPQGLIQAHLDLLNAYSDFVTSVEAMRVVFSDPVRSFAGINQYSTALTTLQNAISEMNTIISKN